MQQVVNGVENVTQKPVSYVASLCQAGATTTCEYVVGRWERPA